MTRRDRSYDYGNKWLIFERDRRQARLYGPVVLLHAMPDGLPVLRGQSSFWTVCGLLVSGRTWRLQLQWRRFSR